MTTADHRYNDGVKRSLRSKTCTHPNVDLITLQTAIRCPDCDTVVDVFQVRRQEAARGAITHEGQEAP